MYYSLVKTYGDIRSTLCIAHSLKHTVTYNQHYIYMYVDYPFVCYMYESYVGHYLNHIFKSFPKNHVHSHSINTKASGNTGSFIKQSLELRTEDL